MESMKKYEETMKKNMMADGQILSCTEKGFETVMQIKCADGRGVMKSYDILPGIQVFYNHFQSFSCPEAYMPDGFRKLEINHCLKGRFECELKNKAYGYVGEGDLALNNTLIDRRIQSFPLGYYQGMEILIDIDEALESGKKRFLEMGIDLEKIYRALEQSGNVFIMRATPQIQHIFMEMYQVDDRIKREYYRLKVYELLLFLSIAEFEKLSGTRKYYDKKQVMAVKSIMDYLKKHPDEKYTVQELADGCGINVNTFRKCFREIYGMPVYQWHKNYRMQYAERLLRETELSVTEIALRTGYMNPSKFSAAFSEFFGKTPAAYRAIS